MFAFLFFRKISFELNADESVAKGAALYAASLEPLFQVPVKIFSHPKCDSNVLITKDGQGNFMFLI